MMLIVEPVAVPDVFVNGLHSIEDIGGNCFRLTCFTNQKSLVDGRDERVVALRFVVPREGIPPAVVMVTRAIGFAFLGGPSGGPGLELVH